MRIQCLITRSFLTRYVDDELGRRFTRFIGNHVDGCDFCRERVHRLELVKRKLQAFGPAEVTDGEWEELWGGIERRLEEDGDRRPFRETIPFPRRRLRYGLLAAAVAVLVAGAVLRLLASGSEPQQTSISSYIQYHEEAVDGHVLLENHFVSTQILPVSYASSR